MECRNRFENLLIALIGIALLILPAGYQLRMQSGIFQLDYYLWWITGLFCWLHFFWAGATVSNRFLQSILPFILLLSISTVYWREDSNSISLFLCCITGLGIFLFLIQAQSKIQFLIWAAVFSVLIQVVFAFQQSFRGDNTITAQFFNSGHWGNFLSMMLPVIILQLKLCRGSLLLQLFHGVILLTLIGFLLLSMARAAIIGGVVGIIFLLAGKINVCFRSWIIAGLLLLMSYAAWLILFTKSASLTGRITIYQVCVEIWKDNWLIGVGPNRFVAIYNHYQAEFLQTANLPIERELLATNMLEAFNLPLQILVEYGLVGASLLSLIVVHWWRFIRIQEPAFSASFVVVLTASLFSNPFHVTPVSFLLLVLLAAASKTDEVIKQCPFSLGKIFSMLQLILVVPYISGQIFGEWYWKRASVQALYEGFSIAHPNYKNAARWLSYRGGFLYNYGAEACIAGEAALAIEQLERAAPRLASNQLYVYLGDAYSKEGKLEEAETAYLKAVAMVPAAIYPRYQLIRFYYNKAEHKKACYWSRKLLEYPVKIASPEATQLLREVHQLAAQIKIYCSG